MTVLVARTGVVWALRGFRCMRHSRFGTGNDFARVCKWGGKPPKVLVGRIPAIYHREATLRREEIVWCNGSIWQLLSSSAGCTWFCVHWDCGAMWAAPRSSSSRSFALSPRDTGLLRRQVGKNLTGLQHLCALWLDAEVRQFDIWEVTIEAQESPADRELSVPEGARVGRESGSSQLACT